MVNCIVCHRPLTAPASIEVGMGPTCAKNRAVDGDDNGLRLHADFDFELKLVDAQTQARCIVIRDLNRGGKSVTNDIENVIASIAEQLGNISKLRIIYQDSNGTWDEAIHVGGAFKYFASIGATELQDALHHIRTCPNF